MPCILSVSNLLLRRVSFRELSRTDGYFGCRQYLGFDTLELFPRLGQLIDAQQYTQVLEITTPFVKRHEPARPVQLVERPSVKELRGLPTIPEFPQLFVNHGIAQLHLGMKREAETTFTQGIYPHISYNI
jgi:hypothetical protein